MSYRRLGLAAVVLVASAPTPSHAATGACVESLSVTFTPPLTLAGDSGWATFKTVQICTFGGRTIEFTVPYVGSCLFAAVGEGAVSLVAGVLHLGLQANGSSGRASVLVPDTVCATSVATGVGVATEAT